MQTGPQRGQEDETWLFLCTEVPSLQRRCSVTRVSFTSATHLLKALHVFHLCIFNKEHMKNPANEPFQSPSFLSPLDVLPGYLTHILFDSFTIIFPLLAHSHSITSQKMSSYLLLEPRQLYCSVVHMRCTEMAFSSPGLHKEQTPARSGSDFPSV